MQLIQIPCRQDNFAIIIHDSINDITILIDAPEHAPIEAILAKNSWQLDAILLTHFHYDHIDAAASLKNLYNCNVYGSKINSEGIDYINHFIDDLKEIRFGDIHLKIFNTPGHTPEQIVFYIKSLKSAIIADTIFSLGCAYILDGTPELLFASLQQICQLPDDTMLYCGHEYTQANGKFAISVDPNNMALQKRIAEVDQLRSKSLPTLPTMLSVEKATNPFLRCNNAAIRDKIGMQYETDVQVFAKLRKMKNCFNT